jgi:hypothetical protein
MLKMRPADWVESEAFAKARPASSVVDHFETGRRRNMLELGEKGSQSLETTYERRRMTHSRPLARNSASHSFLVTL